MHHKLHRSFPPLSRFTALLAALAGLAAGGAQASVTVSNASFETTGALYNAALGGLYEAAGWVNLSGLNLQGCSMLVGQEGTTQAGATDARILRLVSDVNNPVNQGRIAQDLGTMLAGETYTITADVLGGAGAGLLWGATAALVNQAVASPSTVYASQTVSGIAAGANVADAFNFSYTAQPADTGNHLVLWLEATLAGAGQASRGGIDNIRLAITGVNGLAVTVISPTTGQQFFTGTSISATATVANGTSPFTVRFYTNSAGGAYAQAGVASSPPYTVNLSALALGSYGIYATVTDSTAPTPATATSASSSFKVNAPMWNGSVDAQWATSGNWDGGVPGPADTAMFNNAGNGNTTLDLGAGATIKTVLFDTASAAAYTIGTGDIGNQTLTLNDEGGIQLNGTVANNQLFNAALTLGTATAASYTVNHAASARTLTLAGNVAGGSGGAAGAKTLNVASVGTTVIGGVITNGGATSVALTKTGSGVLTLTNANTFSGGVTLTGGTLRLNHATALGTGALTIAGGTLDNTSGGAISNANNNVQSWNANFSFAGNGPLHLGTGAVTLSANRTVTATANALTVGGVVGGGAFSLTKAGVSGRLALSGANTYSGGTVVSAGTLSFLTTAAKPGSGTTTLAAAGGTSLATLGLGVSGPGAFTAIDVDNLFAGNYVGNVANVSLNPTNYVGIDTSLGDFTYAPAATASTRGLNKVGDNTLTLTGVNPAASVICSGGVLTIRGAVDITNGVFAVGSSSGASGTVNIESGAVVNVVNGAHASRTYIGGRIDNLGVAGLGILNLNGGILNLPAGGTGAAGDASSFWLNPWANGGATTLNLNGGVLSSARPFSDGGSGTSVVNFNGGTLQAPATINLFPNNAGTHNVRDGGAIFDTQAYSVTVGHRLQHSTNETDNYLDGGLTKLGSGTLTLAGGYTHTYTGVTTVSNGTLVVAGNLDASVAVNVVAPGALACSGWINGPVALTAGSAGILQTNSAANPLNLYGGLTLSNGNALAFDLGTASDQIAVNYGPFTQDGTATIYLAQIGGFNVGTYDLITGAAGITNTHFTLGTTFSGYSLSLTNPDSATLSLVVHSTAPLATFWHNRSGTVWTAATNWDTDASSNLGAEVPPGAPTAVTFAADAASAFTTTLGADFIISSLTFNTPNNVTIGGPNTLRLNGDLMVNYGAGSNTISAKALTLGTDQTWTVADAANTLWVSSAVGGTKALTVTGTGAVTLSGTNTYTGGTMVNNATLSLAPGGTLNGTAAVDPVSTGTLNIAGLVNITNGVFAVGAGAAGIGTMNLEPGAVVNVVNGVNASRTYIGGKLDGTGANGLGILNLNGGTLNIPVGGTSAAGDGNLLYLNPWGSGGASTVNLNGGVLSTARALADGGNGASVVNLNGGTLQAAASTVLLGNSGNFALGTFNVRNGGAIVDTHGFSATIGSPQLHSTVVGDNATDGGLTKIGAGTLTLLGASTYNGGTTISAGTLLVNNTAGSGTGTGAVTVHSPATLGGTGILVGPVTVQSGGTLSPGASLGTLTVSNDLTLAGNLFIELNKSVAPANDLVVVSGILTNAGVGTVTVTNLGLPALAAGDRFQLFSQPLLNGQALAITPAPGGGLLWANNLALDGSIAVVSGAVPATNLAIVAAGPLSFKLSGAGGANQSYGIYASTNVAAPMSAWWLIGTTNANAGGLIQFLDTQATNQQRFYRFGQ